MSVEKYIKENVVGLCDKVFVAPEIPDKKMNGAIAGMAPEVDPDYVLAIVDTTVFGGAKEGCLFTGEAVYIHAIASSVVRLQLAQVQRAEYICEEKEKENGKTEKRETVRVYFKDGSDKNITTDLAGINKSGFVALLNGIVEQAEDEDDFVSTSQTCPLSMMDAEIKKAYLKLVCNYGFWGDNEIDAEEYAEIISLIVRIEMAVQDRLELRTYMTEAENQLSNECLLQFLESNLEEQIYEVVKKSVLKDIIYISRKKDREASWRANEFVVTLNELLQIEEEQIDCIVSAIINDEDILSKRKNDSEIKKSMKDLAAKASAVGVPLAAIYLSGSVMGISAAGLTSGLAALGMGGLLGFSSMVTGIGVAVLIGVGTYKGVKKVTGLSDLENNKQRELMLQAIIKNSQKSLSYLIEDVNEITNRLSVEIEKGLKSEIQIKKLAQMIGMLTKGAQATSDRIQYAEREKVIAHLPQKLDVMRMRELTNVATKEKYRENILACYIETTAQKEDGTMQTYYELDDRLSCAALDDLHHVLEAIGYFNVADAAMASVKGATKNLVKNIMG